MRFLFFFIAIYCLNNTTPDLKVIRSAYKEAAQDQTKVQAFSDQLASVTKSDDVALIAYKGASITLVARQAETIKEKKDGFIEGVELIEFAIEKEPNAIEPRFVRLGIQENAPKILKYRDDIPEDKELILKQYKYISSKDLKNHVKDYILQSKLFTTEEKSVISGQ
jgi:hypothetical protein